MSGICGFNWRDPELGRRMAGVLAHRGPDQEGVWCDEFVTLAHRRLGVIDLSAAAQQPMGNEDGSVQVVSSGTIFNFAELRVELEGKGHRFRSHSDAEVIVHGYEEWGFEVVHKLIGSFAIGLWDIPRKRLWLVRDRIGIQPLYYYFKDGRLAFGSEIKAILEAPEVERRVNHAALYTYLGFEFIPAPETAFVNVYKVPAGHWAALEGGQLRVESYWDLDMSVQHPERPVGAVVERIRALIDDAVRMQMVADVPLGAFLSGGLDSSTLVAMMHKHGNGRVKTFTIGFPDKTFSELDYAKTVADHFDTDHQVLIIDEMDEASIEKSIWHLDEPMTDLSAIPLMMLCQQAKSYVSVCLSGEGGDEVFAGYDRYKAARLASALNILPKRVRHNWLGKWAMGLKDRPEKKGPVNMFKRFVEGALLPEEALHLRWQYFMNARFEENLFSDSYRARVTFDPFAPVRAANERCRTDDVVNRQAYLDTRFMMTDGVLMKANKLSLASGLDIRVPLLDHRLVEFMGTVPGHLKLRGLTTKYIFRLALEGILPKEIIWRGKQGYSLPVKNLLRTQLKDFMVTLLHDSPLIREDFSLPFVDELIAEHLAMTHNHNHVLWGLMNIAIWHRRFFPNG